MRLLGLCALVAMATCVATEADDQTLLKLINLLKQLHKEERDQPPKIEARHIQKVTMGPTYFTVKLYDNRQNCPGCKYLIEYYEKGSNQAYRFPPNGFVAYDDEAFNGAGTVTLGTGLRPNTKYIIKDWVREPGRADREGTSHEYTTTSQQKVKILTRNN